MSANVLSGDSCAVGGEQSGLRVHQTEGEACSEAYRMPRLLSELGHMVMRTSRTLRLRDARHDMVDR